MTIIIRGEKVVTEFAGVPVRAATAIESLLLEYERARFSDIKAWKGTVENYRNKMKASRNRLEGYED